MGNMYVYTGSDESVLVGRTTMSRGVPAELSGAEEENAKHSANFESAEADLDRANKTELQAAAEERGLDSSGTKAQLRDSIRDYDEFGPEWGPAADLAAADEGDSE